jgi:hypothetical protein
MVNAGLAQGRSRSFASILHCLADVRFEGAGSSGRCFLLAWWECSRQSSSARVAVARYMSSLLFCVRGDGIFRRWRSALGFFRRCGLLRALASRCSAFARRAALSRTRTLDSQFPASSRTTLGADPVLSSGSSLGGGPPFGACPALRSSPPLCSGAAFAFERRSLFPSRTRGRRALLTLRLFFLQTPTLLYHALVNGECEVAWNKAPALGVICIQSGPRG